MPTTTKKPTETKGSLGRPQVDKFREAARELGTDRSEESFDRVLKKIAKRQPPKEDTPKKSPK